MKEDSEENFSPFFKVSKSSISLETLKRHNSVYSNKESAISDESLSEDEESEIELRSSKEEFVSAEVRQGEQDKASKLDEIGRHVSSSSTPTA